MDSSEWYQWAGFLLAPVTGVITWFLGRRKRHNDTVTELQEMIDTLIRKNRELCETVVELQVENAELKASLAELKESIKLLQAALEQEKKERELEEHTRLTSELNGIV